MKNWKKILLSLLVFTCVQAVNAQKKAEPMEWQSTKVVVDGLTGEYPELSRYMSDIKMLYYIGNDSENLYVVLKTYDETMMRKIMLSGLELGLDSTAKKRMKAVLTFPVGRAIPQRRPDEHKDFDRYENEESRANERHPSLEKRRLPEPDAMLLTGFNDIEEGEYPLKIAGIEVKSKGRQGEEFVYEAKIPLKTFFKPLLTAEDKGKVMSITFRLPPFERPEGIPAQGPSQRGGSMGGGPGSGRGQGRMQEGQRPDFGMMASEIIIKRQFILQYNDK